MQEDDQFAIDRTADHIVQPDAVGDCEPIGKGRAEIGRQAGP
jgi:hypothetical protein